MHDKGKSTSNKKQEAFSNEAMNGKTYREYVQNVIYYVKKSSRYSLHLLVHRGANGRALGMDVRVVETHLDCKVDIRGADDNQISSIPLSTVGGVNATIKGEVIVIMNQHEHYGKNKNIHFFPQIDYCKNIVDYSFIKVDSGQHITTLNKWKIHVSILGAFPCMPLRPYTNKEWSTLPHFMLTSDVEWDPTCIDCEGQLENEEYFDAQSSFPDGTDSKLFNEH